MQIQFGKPAAFVLLMALDRVYCTTALNIGKSRGVVKRVEVSFKNLFKVPERRHQLGLRRVYTTQAARFLGYVESIVERCPICLAEFFCILNKFCKSSLSSIKIY